MLAESLSEPVNAQVVQVASPGATQLSTEVVFELLGRLPVTNTMLTATCVTVLLIVMAVLYRITLNVRPSRAQHAAELLLESWLRIAETAGGRRARRFVPLVGTAFIFILFANWFGALPLKHISVVNPAGRSVELFRAATSDLNLTAAVALIVVLVVESLEVRALGPLRYFRSLVVPNPMRWLEMLVRPLSLAFRLFGSVFAGHVLVGTMLSIAPLVIFPFLVLELFMGLIQAVIFSTLTLVFLTIATAHEDTPAAASRGSEQARVG
jgi:F-type H+-transporting ATPase subunit a